MLVLNELLYKFQCFLAEYCAATLLLEVIIAISRDDFGAQFLSIAYVFASSSSKLSSALHLEVILYLMYPLPLSGTGRGLTLLEGDLSHASLDARQLLEYLESLFFVLDLYPR